MMQWVHNVITRRPAPSLQKQIFEHAKQVSPYLVGSLGHIHKDCIAVGNSNTTNQLKYVYQGISRTHPEAGKAYWVTRTWDLVCWQPIYITFISIYGFKSLPEIANIAQYRYKQSILHYRFPNGRHIHGETEELVPLAAKAIMTLTEFYREQISQWHRIRPGFTQHLLGDLLLSCLIKLQRHSPELSNDYIRDQAVLWLNECGLSLKHLEGFSTCTETGKLTYTRTSCCIAYKCQTGVYCEDCPKNKK